MRRDVLAKGEWDETWAWHAREEKQTAGFSHVFEDIQTCQKLIKLTSKPIKINYFFAEKNRRVRLMINVYKLIYRLRKA